VPAPTAFEYAILRVVPRVERGEFINAGVVLFSRPRRYLAAQVELDEKRLAALTLDLDPEPIRRHLDALPAIAAGAADAGPIARLPQSERFGWLVAPVSTVVQASPVHTGLGDDPAVALEALMEAMVRVSRTKAS
jgi:hypothetical protein